MTAIAWGQGDRLHEYGVDHGVLYISGSSAAWYGLTAVEELPSSGSTSSIYFDGIKILDLAGGEDFGLHVSAYFGPEELDESFGPFGLTYRTMHSSGSKLHLVYNATIVPSGTSWQTQSNVSPPTDFEWDISTVPREISHLKPTAHLVVDTSLAPPEAISALEDLLYGTDDDDPTLPSPEEVIAIFEGHATLVVVDHGDGTWTATGPDDMVHMLDATTFEIISPTVIYIAPDTYTVSDY